MTRRAHINSTRPLAPFLFLTLRIFVLLLVVSALASAQTPVDSQRVISVAFPKCDAGGCPDQYKYVWVVNGTVTRTITRPGLRDTTFAKLAPCPANTIVQVTGVAIRRGLPAVGVSNTRTLACKETAPSPLDSIKIDTTNVWRSALRVDSIPLPLTDTRSGWYQVTRADSSVAMVHTIRQMKTPFAIVGATNTAPTGCADGMWYALGDTVSLNVAKARAAQWPTDALTTRARSTWLARDYSQWPTGAVWQGRCG